MLSNVRKDEVIHQQKHEDVSGVRAQQPLKAAAVYLQPDIAYCTTHTQPN